MSDRKIKEGIDRRSFLHSAAAVGAGLVLSPMVVAQTNNSGKNDDINIALLGTGAQGQVLMNAILKMGRNKRYSL